MHGLRFVGLLFLRKYTLASYVWPDIFTVFPCFWVLKKSKCLVQLNYHHVCVSRCSSSPFFILIVRSKYTGFTDKTLVYFWRSQGVYISAEVCMFILIVLTTSWIPSEVRLGGFIVQLLHNILRFYDALCEINLGVISKHVQTVSACMFEQGGNSL